MGRGVGGRGAREMAVTTVVTHGAWVGREGAEGCVRWTLA